MIEPASLGGSAASGWDQFQTTYWNSIATRYNSLYRSPWSKRENDLARRRLAALVDGALMGVVLDLGCGQGLVYELLQRNDSLACYIGADISFEMLCRSAAPKGHLTQQAMDKLGIADRSVAVVLASFSSASYAEDVASLLAETARVLRPNGVGYLSFLSRRALSRLRRAFGPDVYSTRGDLRRWAVAPAHRIQRRQIVALAEDSGLIVVGFEGVNAFSGLVEVPMMWMLGRTIARLLPSSSHTLELTVRVP